MILASAGTIFGATAMPADGGRGGDASVIFERTRVVRSNDTGSLTWPLPPLPGDADAYTVTIQAFQQPGVTTSDAGPQLYAGVFTAETPNGTLVATSGGVAAVDENEGVPLEVSQLTRASYLPYDGVDSVVRLEWATLDQVIPFGPGVTGGWTVTLRITTEGD